MKQRNFDVVVVGGGHAGVEAACAAARLGVNTALVTHSAGKLGEMSCNPAIGGLGKGHIVREIDALDGVMGRAADFAGIQFRLLNRKKGPAVQGPRAQCDRKRYRNAVQAAVSAQPNLEVIEGEVADVIVRQGRVGGVVLSDGAEIGAAAVVLTTGTFLRGVLHIGAETSEGGRLGDGPANLLADRLRALGLPLGRLKTGTPPRLDGRSIDFSTLSEQEGDDDPTMFSFLNTSPQARQVSCHVTRTTAQTHEIIRKNLSRSAMYSGRIEGVGPRYCPSIEDKIVRFADKDSHQIFLEPEGLDDSTIYPNGISTSLPADVQEEYVRSIPGLENARIVQPGYAIEYDYVDPRSLDRRLELRALQGLFLAGQINGTTGYEEAAGQGLVAGLNAGLSVLGRDPFVLDRADAYVGVMIDDLVTRGVSEPYRMFTSRAEYRLSLRADNADQRLTPLGERVGCIGHDRRVRFEEKMTELAAARALLGELKVSPSKAAEKGLDLNRDGVKRSAFELLAYPDVARSDLLAVWPEIADLRESVVEQLTKEAIYDGYLARQAKDVEAMRRDEGRRIPQDMSYEEISGLSSELIGKLSLIRPETLSQAARIEGITPAALTLLAALARRRA